MLEEYSKKYKEYSEQLEKMLAEMKCDKSKLFSPVIGYANYQESFIKTMNKLLVCQREIMLYSELLESVAESFMIPDSCVHASQFK